MSPPLSIWAVSDGRAGIENQVLGLAEAIARLTPSEITRKHLRWRKAFDWLPVALKAPGMLDPASDPVTGDLPDIWIAAGRATLPLSIRMKRRGPLVVQVQNPRLSPALFDMVVAPAHDEVEGDTVFEIIASPHRITPDRIAAASQAFADQLEAFRRPRVAVLIGGRSKAFDLTDSHAAELADRIAQAVQAAGGSLMLTFSRRTPDAARRIMTQRLQALPGWIWDGTGENPLFAFLHFADHILVTEDSANMAAEAASTGRPVHVLPMVARRPAGKFARLHADLAERGATRPFDGALDGWAYEPLAETERAARAVLEALAARGG